MKLSPLFLSVLLLFTTLAAAASAEAPAPEINAASAILIETETGTVLFEKNADAIIPPASMTKLMTIHIVLNYIKDNGISPDTLIPVSAAADFRNAPPHSSLMFLEEGQNVNITELLTGLALPSGNDAGVAVAEFVAGSIDNFVMLMNLETEKLGLINTHFDDSSGYSENNKTTAREYAAFCAYYFNKHPEIVKQIHSLEEFTYPKAHNIPEGGTSVHGPITQPNHNALIGRMKTVDGLKTGYIDESGYNLAASAEFAGRRFIMVTMGGPGEKASDGSMRRMIDGAALLSYGFYGWSTILPEVPSDRELRIYGGKKDKLKLLFSPAEKITIPARIEGFLEFTQNYSEISFPVNEGEAVGNWTLIDNNGKIYQRGTITAAESIGEGNFFKRLRDRFRRTE